MEAFKEDVVKAEILRACPSFYGKPSEDPAQWLEVIQLKLGTIGIDVKADPLNLVHHTKDDAEKWFTDNQELKEWKHFKKAFIARFTPAPRSELQRYNDVQDCTQGKNEPVVAYIDRKLKLIRAYDSKMPPQQQIVCLERNMRHEVIAGCLGKTFESVSAFRVHLDEYEAVQKELAAIKEEQERAEAPPLPPAPPKAEVKQEARFYQGASEQDCRSFAPLPSRPRTNTTFSAQRSGGRQNRAWQQQSTVPFPPSFNGQCYSCGQYGHLARSCPKNE